MAYRRGNGRWATIAEDRAMQERVKVFTFISGHGETIVEPAHEDRINQWLSSVKGRLVRVSQSEQRAWGAGHHVTICIWYIPEE